MSETPPSFSSCFLLIKADRIIEPTIPAKDVKKAVFKPSSKSGIERSRSVVSKAIKPLVIPQNVPNTPRVETKEGKNSTIRRLATNFSLFLYLNTIMEQKIKTIKMLHKQTHVSIEMDKFITKSYLS